jgi:cell pole-organizing protein PopZ
MTALPSALNNQQGSNAAADPSMEEILASIRRIIADDHGTPITPRPLRTSPSTPERVAQAPAPVQELVAARVEPPRLRATPETSAPSQPRISRQANGADREAVSTRHAPELMLDSVLGDRVARLDAAPSRPRPVLRHTFDEPAQPTIEIAPVRPPMQEESQPVIKSPEPMHTADSLLSPLARESVTSAFEALTVSMALQNSSMVEDAVREMLRPMLKDWLDNNLPTVVERLVRAEIERVARGGRS